MTRHDGAARVKVALISHDWSTTTGAGRCAVELQNALEGHSGILLRVGRGDIEPRRHGRLAIVAKLGRAVEAFRVVRSCQVDVVIVNTTIQASVVLATRLAGARLIWWCHESGVALRGPLMWLRLAVYTLLSHQMVAVSCAVPDTRVPRRMIRNITPGFTDTSPAQGKRPGSLLVLGTKSHTKGTDRLPSIIDPHDIPGSFRLEVVGWEDPRDTRMLTATRAALERAWGDRLGWRGPVNDPGEAYAAAAVLLLPSRADSRPRVVEEALQRGIPVVASRLPGLEEIAGTVTNPGALTLVSGAPWNDAISRALHLGRAEHSYIVPFTEAQFGDAWVDVILAVNDRDMRQSG